MTEPPEHDWRDHSMPERAEAAMHGLSGVDNPDPKALATIAKLERKLKR